MCAGFARQLGLSMQDERSTLDKTDLMLLEALQRDGQATAQDLGETLNLSARRDGGGNDSKSAE